MKVLLVHPEDSIPSSSRSHRWDLIIDCARAPASSYEAWSKQTACPILSLYQFAQEIEDLHLCRRILGGGFGTLLDRYGIDWWDVLSLRLVPDLLRLIAVERAVRFINSSCELYATRSFPVANAFQNTLQCRLTEMQTRIGRIRANAQHSFRVLSKLDPTQISQVIQDKFDRHHAIRSRFSRRRVRSKDNFILLPSAYVNVSRTAVRYAQLLPSEQFLLVLARQNARLKATPPNVVMHGLDSYFGRLPQDDRELCGYWNQLRQKLIEQDSTFRMADTAGILDGVGAELRWCLSIRDAWLNLLEEHVITGCMSADDTNPYTRIPLLLAKKRGIPTVACHHGAFDCGMAIKGEAADFYLAKTEMEYDYLVRKCRVDAEKVVLGGTAPAAYPSLQPSKSSGQPDWMVFFTEPYEASHWRDEEIYRDLLPKLRFLAENSGLQLVFKLHPFESVKGHRRMLRRILGGSSRGMHVLAGPITDDLWRKTKFALTVQSSAALECAERGVPVFLLSWLRDPYTGYVPQYASFQIGYTLRCAEEIKNIPQVLSGYGWQKPARQEPMDAGRLKSLLTGKVMFPMAVNS